MNRRSINALVSVLAFATMGGCAAPGTETGSLQEMQEKILAAPRRASALVLQLKEANPERRVQYVRQLDWDTAVATLTNADGTIPPLSQTISATLDATNARRAILNFTPVKPASGYTLTVTLTRKDTAGVAQTVASGTNASVTITPGANTVNVSLTANGQGELLVDVADPVLVLNTLRTEVNTLSHFNVARVAGDATGGNALGTGPTSAAFREISGIDVDSAGNLYVADAGNHQIRRVPTAGASVILAGRSDGASGFAGDGALATTSSLSSPHGLTRDHATGNVFFCDTANNRIRCIASADNRIYTVAGGGANTGATVPYAVNASLNQPFAIAADQAGNVYATERGTGRVLRIDTTGQLTTLTTLGAGTVGPMAIDRAGGKLWVADGATVRLVSGIAGATPTLSPTTVFTATGTTPYVTGLAFDQLGTLYAQQTSDNGTTGASNTKIWRIATDNAGLALSGRAAEVVAGTGATGTLAADYSVPTTAVTNANNQLLAGVSWCSLFIDMSGGLAAGAVSGHLYTGNSYPSAYGQVVKLTPSSLL